MCISCLRISPKDLERGTQNLSNQFKLANPNPKVNYANKIRHANGSSGRNADRMGDCPILYYIEEVAFGLVATVTHYHYDNNVSGVLCFMWSDYTSINSTLNSQMLFYSTSIRVTHIYQQIQLLQHGEIPNIGTDRRRTHAATQRLEERRASKDSATPDARRAVAETIATGNRNKGEHAWTDR